MGTTDSGLDRAELEFTLRLCVNFGVKSLKFRGLEVEFPDEGGKDYGHFGHPRKFQGTSAEKNPVKEITDEQHKKQTADAVEAEEVSLREQQIAELQLTDPKLAEEMIINGEFNDTGDDDDGDSE